MAEDPDTQPSQRAMIPVNNVLHAPFIFYEGVPAMGFMNGVINLTMSANCTYIGPDGNVINNHVIVAYLRSSIHAAVGLRDAIDAALLLATPTAQGVN